MKKLAILGVLTLNFMSPALFSADLAIKDIVTDLTTAKEHIANNHPNGHIILNHLTSIEDTLIKGDTDDTKEWHAALEQILNRREDKFGDRYHNIVTDDNTDTRDTLDNLANNLSKFLQEDPANHYGYHGTPKRRGSSGAQRLSRLKPASLRRKYPDNNHGVQKQTHATILGNIPIDLLLQTMSVEQFDEIVEQARFDALLKKHLETTRLI